MLLCASSGRLPVSEWRVKFSKFSARAFLPALFLLNSHSEKSNGKRIEGCAEEKFRKCCTDLRISINQITCEPRDDD